MSFWKEHLGEFLGTAILVFIGCGSVAIALVYYPLALWQIALIWSYGVAAAIYATQRYSHSHLNPAVTLAMVLAKKVSWTKLPSYFIAQLLGAACAATLLFTLINADLLIFENAKGIVRGDTNSYTSAVMFGEFISPKTTYIQACIAEGLGTFILVFTIFLLDSKNKRFSYINPVFIGLTVGAIIMLVAPYTQAGLNPARDFGPRLVAYLGGWGQAALPSLQWSFLTVYILSPLLGGSLAHMGFVLIDKRIK